MAATDKVNNQDILAPLLGLAIPLNEVPDPVFAKKMMGDGIAIEPMEGLVRAPLTGEIVQFHAAGHAFSIRNAQGIEILIHVGINTVKLKGQGFSPLVQTGAMVTVGQKILEFDLDQVALLADSVQVIVLAVGAKNLTIYSYKNQRILAGEKIFSVPLQNAESQMAPSITSCKEQGRSPVKKASQNIMTAAPTGLCYLTKVTTPEGVHARPAAKMIHELKNIKSQIRIEKNGQDANAASLIGVLNLQIEHNDIIAFSIIGAEQHIALGIVKGLFPNEVAAENQNVALTKPSQTKLENISTKDKNSKALAKNIVAAAPTDYQGVAIAPGKALGGVFQLRDEDLATLPESTGIELEKEKLNKALLRTISELETIKTKMQKNQPAEAAIFAAHIELVSDPELLAQTKLEIAAGKGAALAWKNSFETFATQLAGAKNSLIAQRSSDLRDVGRRLLGELVDPEKKSRIQRPCPGDIVCATEIFPSQAIMLAEQKVAGIVTLKGGTSSHIAILARSLEIPAIVINDTAILKLKKGQPVAIDGDSGQLHKNPNEKLIAWIKTEHLKNQTKLRHYVKEASLATATIDGCPISVAANISELKDATTAKKYSTHDCGLIRTEFLFMNRDQAPNLQEEINCYKEIAAKIALPNHNINGKAPTNNKFSLLKNHPMVFRTLDVGGDKPLKYLPLPTEENPFLGVRGIRLSLEYMEMFTQQIKALVATAKEFPDIHIMFPMITNITEFRTAKAILIEQCKKQGIKTIPCGIMIEVPSAALLADSFAKEVDFFSIGTNDLTQYVLAMDRGHPQLAKKAAGCHPAVLKLIAMTVEAAHKNGKWVGICGGLAGQVQSLPFLLGIGVDEISCAVSSLPEIKYWVRRLSMADCSKLAASALACDDASQVQGLWDDFITHQNPALINITEFNPTSQICNNDFAAGNGNKKILPHDHPTPDLNETAYEPGNKGELSHGPNQVHI